jgi:hypothetical protein
MAETRDTRTTGDPSIREIGDQVKQDISHLREAAERRRDEVLGQARDFVQEHPVIAVGAAFGAGYVLSGALFSRMSLRLLGFGARWYAGRMLRGAAFGGGFGSPGGNA